MEAGQTPPGGQQPQSEEELRARLEEEMKRVRVQDLLLQSVANLVNLTARRIAKEDERDLEQARIGIEAVRALVGLLDSEPQSQVREALSELQMLYAQAGEGEPAEGAGEAPGAGAAEPAERPAQAPPPASSPPSQGQGKGPSRLWTPHERD